MARKSDCQPMRKRTNSDIIIVHHSSREAPGLDWSEKAARNVRDGAATDLRFHIGFPDLDGAAPEHWYASGPPSETRNGARFQRKHWTMSSAGRRSRNFLPCTVATRTHSVPVLFAEQLSMKMGISRGDSTPAD